MSEQPTSAYGAAQPLAASAGAPPGASGGQGADLAAKLQEKPELAVGGAFAGGLLMALILKRLAR